MKAVNLWYNRACIVLYCVVVYCNIHCVFNSVREMFTYECLQLFVVLCFIPLDMKKEKNPDWKKNLKKYLKLHVLSFSSIAYMNVYQRIVSVESWRLESDLDTRILIVYTL